MMSDYNDRRDSIPFGYTPEEYGKEIYERLPMARLTRKESYGLKCYIDYLKNKIESKEVSSNDFEKEIKAIAASKNNNKEIALFFTDNEWEIHIGNTSNMVSLGESIGEIIVKEKILFELFSKVWKKIDRDKI